MWIDTKNFDILKMGGNLLPGLEPPAFKVDYPSLTKDQKKCLKTLDTSQMTIYINESHRGPAPKFENVKKERLKPKSRLMSVIKMVLVHKDRNAVLRALEEEDAHPVVLALWLKESFETRVEMFKWLANIDKYVYQKDNYYRFLAAFKPDRSLKVSYPKKRLIP